MATSGGVPAARRALMSVRKSRPAVYFTSMPLAALKAAVTLRNASCSLPLQSEKTSIDPADFPVERALPPKLLAASAADTTTPTATASDIRRQCFFIYPPRSPGGRSLGSPQQANRRFDTRLSGQDATRV